MWEYFSQNVQQILIAAQTSAHKLGVDYIGSEHLMLGIISHRHNTACRELKVLGVEIPHLKEIILLEIKRGDGTSENGLSFSARSTRIIEIAFAISRTLEQPYVGSEHILLGIIREGIGKPAHILKKEFGIDFNTMIEELYGMGDLKLSNFRQFHGAVDKGLKELEEKFEESSIQKKVFAGKIREISFLMDYVGDLCNSINRNDLKVEVLKLKVKALSSFPGEYLSEDLAIGLPAGESSKVNSIPLKKSSGNSGDLPTEIPVDARPVGLPDNSGLTISININEDIIRKAIFDAVRETTGK
ncbi:MAG: hypothetical protein K8T10_18230 [Candidatus Eremiobacteraeota bacterium]|nr:hypothetical protein [Candidatus Eremiobacteraeota bacterium]